MALLLVLVSKSCLREFQHAKNDAIEVRTKRFRQAQLGMSAFRFETNIGRSNVADPSTSSNDEKI
jgi:hypothetical protein